MALQDQEIVLEIKQEPSWQSEYGSNQEGYEMGFKEGEERSSRSPDSQGTENIEMEELDNESATVEDLGEEWCEDETGNLCDPLCHMSSDVLGSPESSDGGDAGSYSSKRRTTPKGGTQGGRAARALKRTSRGETLRTSTRATPPRGKPPRGKLGNQRSEGHNHNQGHSLDDEEVLGDMPQSPGKRTETDSFAMRKKRKTARLVLTDEQEEGLVEWLQSSPELFDKSHRRYKDIDLKSNLWEQKADKLGVESGEVLQVWYKSMRTRFGKLRRITSVGRKREFTWRDQWILKKFAFISPHIYACPNRGTHPTTGFPIKHKLQSKSGGQWSNSQQHSGSEDDDNDDDLYKIPTIPISTAAPSPSATAPTVSLATSKAPLQIESIQPSPLPDPNPVKQVSQPDAQADQLLAGISAAILPGQNDSMAKGYGTFLSTVVTSLHPSLLTQFYQESWAMVMRYHTQSDELKEKERQRPPVPVTVRPAQPLPQGSKSNPHPAAQPSSKSSQVVIHLEERC
ncbi:uncharacterized protein LOC588106 isoform X3 [Strongylocentrotus purpuratus]|uniref:MADF domain-containing protein n=1 Tax=Strongylocentrotus purpuratus TaxID=7668 RepID=A0A7M7PEW3_STRPU|nr:uncharacterized protein LOC588106 isoform X3 [Strongylocentrotus purpuratus]